MVVPDIITRTSASCRTVSHDKDTIGVKTFHLITYILLTFKLMVDNVRKEQNELKKDCKYHFNTPIFTN